MNGKDVVVSPGVMELAGMLAMQDGWSLDMEFQTFRRGPFWYIEFPKLLQRAVDVGLDAKAVGKRILSETHTPYWADATYYYTDREFIMWWYHWLAGGFNSECGAGRHDHRPTWPKTLGGSWVE